MECTVPGQMVVLWLRQELRVTGVSEDLLFGYMKKGSSPHITFNGFVRGLQTVGISCTMRAYRRLFSTIDENANNRVEVGELRRLLRATPIAHTGHANTKSSCSTGKHGGQVACVADRAACGAAGGGGLGNAVMRTPQQSGAGLADCSAAAAGLHVAWPARCDYVMLATD